MVFNHPWTPPATNQAARGSSTQAGSNKRGAAALTVRASPPPTPPPTSMMLTRTKKTSRAFALAAALATLTTIITEVSARTLYKLDVPARLQFDQNGGYCGEVTLQQLMLPFGVWIPQAYARNSGGGELLPGVNYVKAMDNLKIKYSTFVGSGYKAFAAWAKKQLMNRLGVVTVAYLKGESDRQYDHIMPLVGIDTASLTTSYVYRTDDIFYVNTGYSTTTVQRSAGDYYCTWRDKKDPLSNGGCIPSDTTWGYAVLGPVYAGVGPNVTLRVSTPAEPQLNTSATFNGQLKVTGLRAGGKYKLYRLTNVSKVPASATDTGRMLDSDVLTTFTASAADWTTTVSFISNVPVWYICVVV